MDLKGGVLIVHKIHEGKHQYEVENVVKYKNKSGEKTFARRGDKLIEINGLNLQDLTPEDLAQMLADGNSKLKVHKASKVKEHTAQSFPAADILYPVSKESTLLSFDMEMRREEGLEDNEVGQEEERRDDVEIEEDGCTVTEENGGGGDLLIISMKRTSISVVKGRGFGDGHTCQACNGKGCTLHDVVVVAESSTVTFVSRGSESFRLEKPSNYLIKHVASHLYLRGLCSQRIIYASPNPEKITIYYYKSNSAGFRGMPVILNITGSNCYLRCFKKEEKVFLQLETYEKQKLERISKSDESALSFVFYMKADLTKQRKFESALHLGWFIHVVNTDSVEMGTLDGGMGEQSFLFIIQN